MKVAKPEVDGCKRKLNVHVLKKRKWQQNQEMMEVYKKYDINPMKSALDVYLY